MTELPLTRDVAPTESAVVRWLTSYARHPEVAREAWRYDRPAGGSGCHGPTVRSRPRALRTGLCPWR